MYKFLIADDHSVVRRGIKEILVENYPTADFVLVSNAEELMQQVVNKELDLVITDITMPGRSGLDILNDLNKEFPKLPVLILSVHPEEEYAVRVIKAGGAGYLCKDDAVEEQLVKAVEVILAGRKYITPSLAQKLASEISGEYELKLHETLSDREYEIFILFAKGVSTGKIAKQLSLSVNTVGTFRRRILEKMKIRNNAGMVAYALKNNLI